MRTIDKQKLLGVQATVSRHLNDLGAEQAELERLAAAILCDGREQVAVRFRAGSLIAIWDLPAERIRFYDSHACPLRTVAVGRPAAPIDRRQLLV